MKIANIFIIGFMVLWFTNHLFGQYYYPDMKTIHTDWDNAIILREIMFEKMFIFSLLLGVFKQTRLSKSLSVFSIILVISSIIDKQIHEEYHWTYYDPIVILFASTIAIIIYINERK
tara:strand:- start:368 stop:718 length:351 start_codon:yes stop_codon:yes gene_type:complete